MTSPATSAPPVETDTTEAKPKPYAVFTLLGRDIEFKPPTPEGLMVMRRLNRQLGDAAALPSRQIILMAKILDAVSGAMVSEEDVDYVDQLVLDRKVGMEELVPMIAMAIGGQDVGKPAPKTGPAKRVRRR